MYFRYLTVIESEIFGLREPNFFVASVQYFFDFIIVLATYYI